MVDHKIKRLNEEIARWAFEIKVKNKESDWKIAFTNPTAGPWKTIKYFDENGKYGEVYRYPLEENRPDVLLVNEKLKLVLIVEAKDSMPKLMDDKQVVKSCQVVADLSEILKNLHSNQFWGHRSQYSIITGLLWGTESISTKAERNSLFKKYRNALSNYSNIENKYIVGIESFHSSDDTIKCFYYIDALDEQPNRLANLIEHSFEALKD